ncbi:MAG: choice-of-anchor Q domain-containing protein [Solirubrobacterales bacterium]
MNDSTTITGSTISGNRAVFGGGLLVEAAVEATNTTIAGNSATLAGGGIDAISGADESSLNAVTIARNRSEFFGGAGIRAEEDADDLNLNNSLVVLNTTDGTPDDCYADGVFGDQISSLGLNVGTACGAFGAASDRNEVKTPRIGKLAKNGGPTRTIALRKGSVAINRAGADAPARDQRGFKRRDPDVGAFERR